MRLDSQALVTRSTAGAITLMTRVMEETRAYPTADNTTARKQMPDVRRIQGGYRTRSRMTIGSGKNTRLGGIVETEGFRNQFPRGASSRRSAGKSNIQTRGEYFKMKGSGRRGRLLNTERLGYIRTFRLFNNWRLSINQGTVVSVTVSNATPYAHFVHGDNQGDGQLDYHQARGWRNMYEVFMANQGAFVKGQQALMQELKLV